MTNELLKNAKELLDMIKSNPAFEKEAEKIFKTMTIKDPAGVSPGGPKPAAATERKQPIKQALSQVAGGKPTQPENKSAGKANWKKSEKLDGILKTSWEPKFYKKK